LKSPIILREKEPWGMEVRYVMNLSEPALLIV